MVRDFIKPIVRSNNAASAIYAKVVPVLLIYEAARKILERASAEIE